MKLGLIIYGSLDSLSGGYLYDRKLVDFLRQQGDHLEIISLPKGSYGRHLIDNVILGNLERFTPAHGRGLDLLIQDELNHPSLLAANAKPHPYPIISLVHHLRSLEQRPVLQNALYRWVEKQYVRSVDGFIFNSQTTRQEVQELVSHQIPYIVANPPTDRLGLGVSEQEIIERAQTAEFRVLFLGNVIRRKGLHTLLEALRLLPTPVQVDVVGALGEEASYSRQMQRISSRLSAGSPVHFHGHLDNEPLIDIMKQAHVLVIPSLYEGFGIAYLEGMGFGLPAIGTSLGAAREVIVDRVDGFIVPPAEPRVLAERLRLLGRDRQMLIRMGLAARERYQRQPSWEITATRIRRFLEKLVNQAAKA